MNFILFLLFLFPIKVPYSLLYEGENPINGWALYDDLTGPIFTPFPLTLYINEISFEWIQDVSFINSTPFEEIEANLEKLKLKPYFFKEEKPLTLLFSKRGLYDLNHLGLLFGRPVGKYLDANISFDYRTVTPYTFLPEKKFNQFGIASKFTLQKYKTEFFTLNASGENKDKNTLTVSYFTIASSLWNFNIYYLNQNSLYNMVTKGGKLEINILPTLTLISEFKILYGIGSARSGKISMKYERKAGKFFFQLEGGGNTQEREKLSPLFDFELGTEGILFSMTYRTRYLHPALPLKRSPEKRFNFSSELKINNLQIEINALRAKNLVVNEINRLEKEEEVTLFSIVPSLTIPLPLSTNLKWSLVLRESSPKLPYLRKRDFRTTIETTKILKDKSAILKGKLILSFFDSTENTNEAFVLGTQLILDLWGSVRIKFESREFYEGTGLLPNYPLRHYIYRLGVAVLLWD